MCRIFSCDRPLNLVSKLMKVQSRKQMLAFAQQHRGHRHMHFIDRTQNKILPDRRHASSDPHVLASRRFLCLLQRRLRPIGNEMESRAAFHLQRRSRMMRQNKHRGVIRRLVTPPSFPRLIRPWPAYWPKHVPPENPRAHILKGFRGHFIVNAVRPAALPRHLPEYLGREKPLMQLSPAHTKRIFQILLWTGAKSIHRNRKYRHSHFHSSKFPCFKASKSSPTL